MKKHFAFLVFGLVYGVPFFVSAAASDIVIKEVLFDPEGIDTGLEYIIIENTGGGAQALSGWDLYSNSGKYYTFSSFSLSGGESVTVHLRASGNDSENDLYHASATANMGNSAGSIALFSSTDHSASTLIDFVQYGRGGETWESSAESATLWTKGAFVALSGIEGQSLRRIDGGHGVASWSFSDASVEVVHKSSNENTGHEETQNNSQSTTAGGGGTKYVPPELVPTIKALAGSDKVAVAGALVLFEGKAYGWDDRPVVSDTMRFFWNFGDGNYKDGRNADHIYQYPGTYTVNLEVIQGADVARDSLVVKVGENPVIISEIMPGGEGWIELSNSSSHTVDISGWIINNGSDQQFVFPANTRLAPRSYTVFSHATTHITFVPVGLRSFLLYPNAKVASELRYPNIISEGKSVSKDGAATPTPGNSNQKTQSTPIKTVSETIPPSKKMIAEVAAQPEKSQKTEEMAEQSTAVANTVAREVKPTPRETKSSDAALASTATKTNYIWLSSSIAGGLIVGLAALGIRKRYFSVD